MSIKVEVVCFSLGAEGHCGQHCHFCDRSVRLDTQAVAESARRIQGQQVRILQSQREGDIYLYLDIEMIYNTITQRDSYLDLDIRMEGALLPLVL